MRAIVDILKASDRQPSIRARRSVLLDCIRGFAVLAVLIYHVGTRYDSESLDQIAMVFRNLGHFGVDIFFPLSGYLITHYLLKARTSSSIATFFLRRLFRIVPLYFVAVTAFVVASISFAVDRDLIGSIWSTYLLLTGWFIFENGHAPFKITWSLSVEEFAYIIFGCVAWIQRVRFISFLITVSIAAFLLRLYLQLSGYTDVHYLPPARLDSIAIGGITAYLVATKVPRLTVTLALLTVLTSLLAYSVPILWSTLQYVILSLGTCFLISYFETELQRERNTRLIGLDALSSVGFYSYFIYLFHLFNIDAFLLLTGNLFPDITIPFWFTVSMAVIVTQVQAIISYRFFEGPLMRYGRSLEPSNV